MRWDSIPSIIRDCVHSTKIRNMLMPHFPRSVLDDASQHGGDQRQADFARKSSSNAVLTASLERTTQAWQPLTVIVTSNTPLLTPILERSVRNDSSAASASLKDYVPLKHSPVASKVIQNTNFAATNGDDHSSNSGIRRHRFTAPLRAAAPPSKNAHPRRYQESAAESVHASARIGAVNMGTSHPDTRFPIGIPPRNAQL